MGKYKLQEERKLLLFCFIITFIWGLAAHAYGFLHSSFSHDTLNAFYANLTEERCKIELGRFIVPVYRSLVRGQLSLPWLIGLISMVWISLSVFITAKIFDVKSKGYVALISGIMATNISVTALSATYMFEFDFDMFALVMSLAAVYLWEKHCNLPGLLTASICVAVSIGIYQSYFSVSLSLIMILSFISLLGDEDIKKIIIKLIKGIAMLVAGGVLYYILSAIIYAVTDIEPLGRTNVFYFDGISNLLSFYINLFADTYKNFALNLINYKVYPVPFIYIVTTAVVMITAGIVIFSMKGKSTLIRRLLTVAVGVIIPFCMNVTYFLARGEGVHDLMTYAIWFTYIALLVLAMRVNTKSAIYLRIASCVIVAVVVWQNVIIANTAYVKKDMEDKAALSFMTRVVALMEGQENYVPGETPVAFVGTSSLDSPINGFEKMSGLVGMHENTPITYYETYEAYFKYVLNYPLKLYSAQGVEELKANEAVMSLGTFPDKSCTLMTDGVLVIKLGNN